MDITCVVCKQTKDVSLFPKDLSLRQGYRTRCKSCKAEAKKAWKLANPKKVLEEKQRYRKANPEKIKDYNRSYKKLNPGLVRADKAARRATKVNATPSWSETEMIKKVYDKAREYGSHVDHIVPLKSSKVCGLHVWANLQIIPPELNLSKNNRYWPDQW